jgi:hypothetical protein
MISRTSVRTRLFLSLFFLFSAVIRCYGTGVPSDETRRAYIAHLDRELSGKAKFGARGAKTQILWRRIRL